MSNERAVIIARMRTLSSPGSRFLVALTLCLAPLQARPAELETGLLQGLGDTRYHLLTSQILQRDFHVFVRLPERYREQPDHGFPTVYLLDGGITFPLLAGYYRYLSLAEELPDAILVGVSYGAESREEGNMRGTDFTAASPEREHYGGAPRFQTVLRQELLPLIEGEYRSDAARRIIFGQSLGGQFVLYTAQTDPGLFYGHIASNPALHRNLSFFLQPAATTEGGGKLFVSSAEHDDERFKVPAGRWIEHWSASAAKPWELQTEILEGHNHFSAAPAAFRRGMLWILGEP
jgi:predicted alpha/beta superfamily hydrolase